MLNPPLPERVRKLHVDRNGVRWSDKITLPYEPFIGTIGVSPEIEAISSLQPDYHGGNMDLPDVGAREPSSISPCIPKAGFFTSATAMQRRAMANSPASRSSSARRSRSRSI